MWPRLGLAEMHGRITTAVIQRILFFAARLRSGTSCNSEGARNLSKCQESGLSATTFGRRISSMIAISGGSKDSNGQYELRIDKIFFF